MSKSAGLKVSIAFISWDQADDNFWDFESPGLHNDTFELVVDGDLSGGPLIPQFRLDPAQDEWDSFFSIGSVMAQNYHIFTPAVGKDWAMAFGCEPWVKEMPYANHAASYSFKQGESGKYVMEFWITPFDYAGCEGPQRAVESKLEENKIIGISWAVIDYDGPAAEKRRILEPVQPAQYVWECHVASRISPDAAGATIQGQWHSCTMVF